MPRPHQVYTGGIIIGVKWVDVNKGCATNTNYRSTLVGREFNVSHDDALYAATFPLEALRVVISHAATHSQGGARRSVMVNDVRRAHFYVNIQNDMYFELPLENNTHRKMPGRSSYTCTACGSCEKLARSGTVVWLVRNRKIYYVLFSEQ